MSNSPARLLNDTTAVYLWSSSTVSVELTVSILLIIFCGNIASVIMMLLKAILMVEGCSPTHKPVT